MQGEHPITGVHGSPPVLTVHGTVSEPVAVPLQVPALHTGVEHVRL
jgi:hypothetical protein